MKITMYGTRGSIPIANRYSIKYGGNTTCLRVESNCLPPGLILTVDAGTGFVPLTRDAMERTGMPDEVMVLFTHYHHDHTQGLFLSQFIFNKNVKKTLVGPCEHNVGPKEMMEMLMRPPFFPVHFRIVSSAFRFKGLEFPETVVALFHRLGGYKLMDLDEFHRLIVKDDHLPIGKGKYPAGECLVVTMTKSQHPEQTISYRLEERPTKKVFVFMTDHENEDGISAARKAHAANTDLLIMDSQYPREFYDKFAGGFGHGTPDYCVRFAETVGAKKLGLTHHDPKFPDDRLEAILEAATAAGTGKLKKIFLCADYQEIEL